jgi:hypothetical protein
MIAARGRENIYIEYVCMQALFSSVSNSVEIYTRRKMGQKK